MNLKQKLLRMVSVVLVSLALSGCATMESRSGGERPIYGGTIMDLQLLATPLLIPLMIFDPDAGGDPAIILAAVIVGAIDLPFSFIADTYLLPRTIKERRTRPHIENFLKAIKKGDLKRAKMLIADNPSILNGWTKTSSWPSYVPLLNSLAETGKIDGVKLLLEHNVDVNLGNKVGETPLHVAAINGHTQIARLLVEHGADVSARRDYCNWRSGNCVPTDTPLHEAAKRGHRQIASLLIEYGADVNAKDVTGETPLYNAAEEGQAKVVRFLIEHGANVNVKTTFDYTPLYIAAMRGQAPTVELLIEGGADINVRGHSDNTPLHMAVNMGHALEVKLLTLHGADVNARNKDGKTPLGIAIEKRHMKIIKLLKKHNARK